LKPVGSVWKEKKKDIHVDPVKLLKDLDMLTSYITSWQRVLFYQRIPHMEIYYEVRRALFSLSVRASVLELLDVFF
jgi:hypothetical protein